MMPSRPIASLLCSLYCISLLSLRVVDGRSLFNQQKDSAYGIPDGQAAYKTLGQGSQIPLGTENWATADLNTSSSGSYWLGQISHQGSKSIYDPSYTVYRNVMDFGAKGDGVSDDTSAIQSAISSGNRCEGFNCQGSTKTPALVYFPPGTYLVSQTLKIGMYTQLTGDAINWPTLKATSGFGPNVVIDGLPMDSNGKRWSNDAAELNFHKSIRNLIIDVRAVDSGTAVSCINWPVAQATSLSSIVFNMNDNSQHLGVTMNGGASGGGSGIFMGDLYFNGGDRALTISNQQFHFRNMQFNGAHTAIQVNSINIGIFQDIQFFQCGTGINIGWAGSLTLLDSTANSVGTVISTRQSGNGDGSIIIDNLSVTNVGSIAHDSTSSQVILAGTDNVPITVDTWTQGNIYFGQDDGRYMQRTLSSPSKPSVLLDGTGKFFTRSRPAYADANVSDIVNVKDQGAKGDGQSDDTAILNSILLANARAGKITYFPHGYYVVSDTIYVPPNSKIIGEVWSAINARGSNFKDENNPRAVVQVGKPGDVGFAEISDMLFEGGEILPGAILVEFNMKPAYEGAIGMWDSVMRVGGAASTGEVLSNCNFCKAAFLMMHVTQSGSGYFENLWLWTADHSIDQRGNPSIATGRGVFVESRDPTWLVGLGIEHNTLYACNVVNARNIFMGLIQVETPYWEPAPAAPAGWTLNSKYSDPDFTRCNGDAQCAMAWAMRIVAGSDTFSYGSGTWLFFNGGQGHDECSKTGDGNCQDSVVSIEGIPENLVLYNLNVRAVKDVITINGQPVAPRSFNPGGWGGVVAAYLRFSGKRNA